MPRTRKPPFLVIDLPDDEAARRAAQAIARRAGYEVVVKDAAGIEVASATPPRRNELVIRPKTSA
jgi:hypothetical protein